MYVLLLYNNVRTADDFGHREHEACELCTDACSLRGHITRGPLGSAQFPTSHTITTLVIAYYLLKTTVAVDVGSEVTATVTVELVGGSDVGPSPNLLPPERPGQTKLTCLVVKSGNGFGRFISADVLAGFLGTLIDSSVMNCLQPQVMKPSTTFSGPPQAACAIGWKITC